MTPQISVIMPCLNSARHIRNAVASVLAQTLDDFELLIVDNGSTDSTLDIVAAIADRRIRILHQPQRGVSWARNLGLECARGAVIAFLDSDDTWSVDFLEKMSSALAAHPDAVLAYCGWQNLGLPGPRGQPFIPPDYEVPGKTQLLLEGCRWPIHACLTRQSAVQQIGGFDPELKIGEDFLFWMEVGQLGKIRRVPKVLAFYHHHGDGQATQDRGRAAIDTLRAKQKFLAHHPGVAQRLGSDWVEAVTWGKFVEQANALYWSGDIEGARLLYVRALRAGRGSARDKLRLMATLLPSPLLKIIGKFGVRANPADTP